MHMHIHMHRHRHNMNIYIHRAVPSTYCECIKAGLRGRYHIKDFLNKDHDDDDDDEEEASSSA